MPSREVDKNEGKFWTYWNKDTKQFFLQFSFKAEPKKAGLMLGSVGGMPPRPPGMPVNLPPPPMPMGMVPPPPPAFNAVPPPPPN